MRDKGLREIDKDGGLNEGGSKQGSELATE